jgi:hypothetical protein
MKIKQSVVNTFDRVGINYKPLMDKTEKITVQNRFGGGSCETSPLVAYLINWVYSVSNLYEIGQGKDIKISDFDRVRYFILEVDANAYSTCID